MQDIMYDPQTSGGLLIAVDEVDAQALLAELRDALPGPAVIGWVTEKEEEVRMLQEKLHSFQPDIFNPEIWEHETTIQNSTIIIHMHKLASKGLRAGSSELSAVRQLCNTVYPSFLPKLSSLYPSLTLNQTNLCILIRLRFIPSEIASLLGNSVQAISNMRARLYKKMFHSDGSARGFNERILAL